MPWEVIPPGDVTVEVPLRERGSTVSRIYADKVEYVGGGVYRVEYVVEGVVAKRLWVTYSLYEVRDAVTVRRVGTGGFTLPPGLRYRVTLRTSASTHVFLYPERAVWG